MIQIMISGAKLSTRLRIRFAVVSGISSLKVTPAFSSLLTLVGLYPPTSDFNVVAGWALLVFILITSLKWGCRVRCFCGSPKGLFLSTVIE